MSQHVSRASVTRAGLLALLLVLVTGLLGCSSGTQPQDTNKPSFLLRATVPVTEQPGNAPVQAKSPLKLRVKPQLPEQARQFLTGFSAPQLPANPAAEKRPSVLLPTGFTGDWAYTSGDQGYLSSHNVSFPGPPMGGADMLPTGPDYPNNISWIIYRIDDIVGQDPGMLTISMGLTVPGTMVGVAPYNWAYGSNGQWEPLFFDDPNNHGGQIQIQLFGFPGEDFTNANDDLAFMVFCLHPGSTNVSTIQLEEGGGGGTYDEIEDNDDPLQAQALPPFNFSGFTGNIGIGGPNNSDIFDIFTFTANTGDTVEFVVSYDPVADYDGSAGVIVGIVDQAYFDTGGQGGLILTDDGAGGFAQVSYTLDGSEQLPIYFAIQNLNEDPSPVPHTDYTISAQGPGGIAYDEFEDNDAGQANYLGDMDFVGSVSWLCSLGSDVTYPGYDGDLDDWFAFADVDGGQGWSAGETATITITYPAGTGNFRMEFYSIDGQLRASSPGDGDGTETISYTVDGSEQQPFFINVLGSGFGDYQLDGQRN